MPRRVGGSPRSGKSDIRPIRTGGPRRRYRTVAERIVELIAAGVYPARTMLPPERELATRLEVSRSTVREAIAVLETLRIVNVRMNHGIEVTDAALSVELPWRSALLDAAPNEQLSALRPLAAEAAAIAALKTHHSMQQPLADLVARMETKLAAGESFEAERIAFHCGLADVSGNGVLGVLMRQLWAALSASAWTDEHRGHATAADLRREIGSLRKVLQALREGLPPEARSPMESYFRRLEGVWPGGEHSFDPALRTQTSRVAAKSARAKRSPSRVALRGWRAE
jgi:DNA-binding FadR family transcriptional regulator